MKRSTVAAVWVAATLALAPAAHAYDDGGDPDCRSGDCSNEQHHRGNFSPGPFDRSPVDASHNNFDICISPDCSRHDGQQSPPNNGGK